MSPQQNRRKEEKKMSEEDFSKYCKAYQEMKQNEINKISEWCKPTHKKSAGYRRQFFKINSDFISSVSGPFPFSFFDFVMKTEGLDFIQAVEQLAREVGLEMPARGA